MKKTKRCLALLIVMIMTATVCIGKNPVTAFADETTEGVVVEESGSEIAEDDNEIQSTEPDNGEESDGLSEDRKDEDTQAIASGETDNAGADLDMAVIEEVVNLFEQLPEASEVESLSENELSEVMQQTTDAINAFDGLEIDECNYFIENYPELYSAVMEDLSNALAAMQQGDVSTMSLLPLEEVKAYLVLYDKTEEQLKEMSVVDMLDRLQDINGDKIAIEDSATTVWRYVKDETDGIEQYEEYQIDSNTTIDLSINAEINNYQMELVVGNGKQLSSDNKRYIVNVYLSDNIEDQFDFELYTQDEDGTRTKIIPNSTSVTKATNYFGWEEINTRFRIESHTEGSEYYLGVSSTVAELPYMDVEVYDFVEYILGGEPITDQILFQNMKQTDAGYKSDAFDSYDGGFVFVYTDTRTEEVTTKAVEFQIYNKDGVTGHLCSLDNGSMESNAILVENNVNFNWDNIFPDDETFVTTSRNRLYMLNEGLHVDDEYYFYLDIYDAQYGTEADNFNSHVIKAVEGQYDSIDEATDATDIKEYLTPTDKSAVPYGYKANYDHANENGGVTFTIFYDDGTKLTLTVGVIEYNPLYDPDYVQEYTDAPIIGESDPWFRVTGANDSSGNAYDTYIIENGKNINIDTMYGYGYQTVFINENVDSFIPTFWKANDEAISIDRIYANGREFQEGSEFLFPEGENTLDATFSVIITDKNGSHTKNYDVTFVKKASGPQLYVAGPLAPDVRSVFLDEYHENKHDIFIANIGDEPLTDLWLDLDATNVELDDYWTIGGEGNNTLEACPDNFSLELDSTSYGELSNVAKIRLVPPSTGKGEIEGTLKIYSGKEGDAENSELLATVILSDLAQNPEITTEEVDDAVKYVPYSYLITTDNMYDWVNVSYELTEGSLPEGVELIEETGELYGVPQETGTFTFTVSTYFESTSENYAFDSSEVELTLTVNDNTDDNVFNATDAADNYGIMDAIGTEETAGDHHYILEDYSNSQVFRSEGEFGQFVDVWLNGEKLEKDVDYTAEEGSTRITINSQTFVNKANKNGERNTIAAEFRTTNAAGKNDKNNSNELRRTSQNFYITERTQTPGIPGTGNIGNGNAGNGSSGTGNTGNSSYGQAGTGSGGTGTYTSSVPNNQVGIRVHLLNADGNPINGMPIELHSTPQYLTTDMKGYALFDAIDFGAHTLYVTNDNGERISKEFELVSGSTVNIQGDTVTAQPGTIVELTVVFDGTTLEIKNAEKINIVQTGDNGDVSLWYILLAASLSCAAVVVYMGKRKRTRRHW